MKKINALANQTLYDIAVAEYGTVEVINELLELNPELVNDLQAREEMGIDEDDSGFYLDLPLMEGSSVWVDDSSRAIKKNIVREIDKEVTTYDQSPEKEEENQNQE